MYKSGYKALAYRASGVCFTMSRGEFEATVLTNDGILHLGYFKTLSAALIAHLDFCDLQIRKNYEKQTQRTESKKGK